MASQEHLDLLKQGAEVWNMWREAHPDECPNLTGADLSGILVQETDQGDIDEVEFGDFDLRNADLSGANLQATNLSGAQLFNANFSGANLREADLSGANLVHTTFYKAKLIRASLYNAQLDEADLRNADLMGARLFYGKAETASPRSKTEVPNYVTGEHTGAVIENADFTDVHRLSDEQRYYCCAWGGSKTRSTIPGGCEGIPNKLGR